MNRRRAHIVRAIRQVSRRCGRALRRFVDGPIGVLGLRLPLTLVALYLYLTHLFEALMRLAEASHRGTIHGLSNWIEVLIEALFYLSIMGICASHASETIKKCLEHLRSAIRRSKALRRLTLVIRRLAYRFIAMPTLLYTLIEFVAVNLPGGTAPVS